MGSRKGSGKMVTMLEELEAAAVTSMDKDK